MKIKDNFLLKNVAGKTIVVPVGSVAINFNAVVTLNDTGAFLFKKLQETDCTEQDLADAICAEYSVERETALKDISVFVAKINDAGMME